MKYVVKVEWPESQEWLERVEYDEETGEVISDIEPGPDASAYVPVDIYQNAKSYLDGKSWDDLSEHDKGVAADLEL